jgi:predicted nucleotidyltransferase
MKLPFDFRDLLEEFASAAVEYVLVGGYAVSFHAKPRATKDLDILLRDTQANRERAAAALARYGAPSNVVSAVRTLGPTEVAYMGQPPLRVDFLYALDGVETEEVFEHALKTSWDGVPVRVISLDDLLRSKRAAGRKQDIADVEALERARDLLMKKA